MYGSGGHYIKGRKYYMERGIFYQQYFTTWLIMFYHTELSPSPQKSIKKAMISYSDFADRLVDLKVHSFVKSIIFVLTNPHGLL